MKLKCFVLGAVWILPFLPTFRGESLCTREVVKKCSNVSAELQSDVLLPCNFEPALLGSDMTANLSVVWQQINTTVHGLLEITLQGEAKFWDSKDRRIKPFPKLSVSGNFSILLRKVQPFDLGLYRCELFNGTNCRIAYQEIQLGVRNQPTYEKLWRRRWIIIGSLAGGIGLFAVLITYWLRAKGRQNIIIAETDYDNAVVTIAQSASGSQSIENPIYHTLYEEETDIFVEEDNELSSDTPVYATVKKGKKG